MMIVRFAHDLMTDTATTKPKPLILYVDDERGNRVVFEQSLSSEFALKIASDAKTALEILEQHEIALIVTDMRMPTMNGEELLRIVKERHPQVIRMVMTAYSDIEPILRAINEGLVARYIVKPWVRAEPQAGTDHGKIHGGRRHQIHSEL